MSRGRNSTRLSSLISPPITSTKIFTPVRPRPSPGAWDSFFYSARTKRGKTESLSINGVIFWINLSANIAFLTLTYKGKPICLSSKKWTLSKNSSILHDINPISFRKKYSSLSQLIDSQNLMNSFKQLKVLP